MINLQKSAEQISVYLLERKSMKQKNPTAQTAGFL
jgi:hypothetical protein